jgi:hypothetical protein
VRRYWQHEAAYGISTSESPDYTPSGEGWTEVQVVPLDAIVIERADLPKVTDVTVEDDGALIDGDLYDLVTVEQHTRSALVHLTRAEYLREHPPVDEAQVAALNRLIVDAVQGGHVTIEAGESFERFLVARGVRVVTP